MLKILKPLRKCTQVYFPSLFKHLPYNLCPSFIPTSLGSPTIFGTISAKQSKSGSDNDKDTISTSTILVQDGLNFQELPVVIKKTSKLFMAEDLSGEFLSTDEDDLETIAKFQRLAKCQSLDEVLDLLNTLQPSEVTSALAAFSLTCFTDHQEENEIRDNDLAEENDDCEIKQYDVYQDAIVHKLFDIVCQNGKTSHLLTGLYAVVHSDMDLAQNPELFEKLCDTFLLRLNEGAVGITDIYEFATLLQTVRGNHVAIVDQLWLGISDKSTEIDISTLLLMYRLLPLFQHSRNMVFKVLERKCYQLWWQLRIKDVMGILFVLIKIKMPHGKLITSLTKWVNLNIHLVEEKELTNIINSLSQLGHIDMNIVTAIERLVKVKNRNIVEALLVSEIMCYCLKFRLRSPTILDNVATYFVANATNLSPICFLKIVKPFGLLNYLPSNSYDFYTKLEDVLQAKFIQFRPEDVIELLLSCTYIQRFPQNFVKRIFSQQFLDRLSTVQVKSELQKTYDNLNLLDAAMTLECRYYRGPMLSNQHDNGHSRRDGRISKQVNRLSGILTQILGGRKNFAVGKQLNKLPICEMYIVDFIVNLNIEGKPIPFGERSRPAKRIAVVINLPEYYCYNSTELIGQQATKIRHLQKLGYSVVQLDCAELASITCEKELKDLLNRKLFVNFQ